MTAAVAIDLGSTHVKAARLHRDGVLQRIKRVPAPVIVGHGLIRESDPLEYLRSATGLLQEVVGGLPENTPVGIASQRSTFLLWSKETGEAITPLISWQDRRAAPWCRSHTKAASKWIRNAGLPLSPHYAGPKLANILSSDTKIRAAVDSGGVLFGTLDSFVLWHWTKDHVHQTDWSMAARTLLTNPQGAWSEDILRFFGIPSTLLPELRSSTGIVLPLKNGGIVTATLADQGAAVLPIEQGNSNIVLVNLGTGGFVIHPIGSKMQEHPGYLAGPALVESGGTTTFVIEGTINGIAHSLANFGYRRNMIAPGNIDRYPDNFCLPESSGIGSPYWLPDMPFTFSKSAENCHVRDQLRLVLEGIIFRIHQIICDLPEEKKRPEVFLSGGLAGEAFIGLGLAACLEQPVYRLHEQEMTLLGTATVAAQLSPPQLDYSVCAPNEKGAYLPEKYLRWRKWLEEQVENFRTSSRIV